MKVRLLITIGLVLSLVFLANGMITTLKTDPLATLAAKPEKQKRARKAPVSRATRFYPPPPPVLPNLNKDYIFNEERSLEGPSVAKTPTGKQEIRVDMNEVFYLGSVITDKYSKGIVSYPVSKAPTVPAAKGRRTTTRKPSKTGKRKQVFLVPGDSLSGYQVTVVAADRIVFKKGSEVVEKLLNDPDKTRKAVAPKPKARKRSPAATARTTRTSKTSAARRTTKSQSTTRTSTPRQQQRQPTGTTQSRSRTKPKPAKSNLPPLTEAEIRAMEREIQQIEQQRTYQKR